MMGIGLIELIIIGIVAIGLLGGVVAAIVVATTSRSRDDQ
jgi:hypothetical protein